MRGLSALTHIKHGGKNGMYTNAALGQTAPHRLEFDSGLHAAAIDQVKELISRVKQ